MPYTTIITPENKPYLFKLLAIRDEIGISYKRKLQTIDKLSGRFNIGKKALTNNFKKAFESSLPQFVKEHYLTKGLDLLNTRTYERVYDVAQIVGYADESSFTGAFRKRFGSCPGEYRRRVKMLDQLSGMA